MHSKQLVDYILNQNDDGLIKTLIDNFLNNSQKSSFSDKFDYEAAKNLAVALEAKLAQGNTYFKDIAANLPGYHSPVSLFLEYYLNNIVYQNKDKAAKKLDEAISLLPKSDPYLLLERARLFLSGKQFEKAAADLKNALLLYPPYPFYITAEKTLKKIIKSDSFPVRRRIKIALLSNSTTSFLVPVLKAVCFRNGILADIYEGGFGNYRQEILNEASGLYTFAPDVVVIFLNNYDLHLNPDNYLGTIDKTSEDIKNLWSHLKKRHPCHIIQAGYDYPPDGAWGLLEDVIPGGRNRIINRVNLNLSENLPAGLSFIDMGKIQRLLGKNFFSDKEWHNAKQYPSAEALPVFSEYIAAHLRAVFGLSAKVLVVDLDNTLWGGIIGEDGLDKIALGPGTAEGEAYIELQKYIKDLNEKGILLAVCSKNNLNDAKLPFEEHQSMVLKFEDFIIFTANWDDKAGNIKNMAQELSLGLDSFVFLDDNPLEREWVKTKLPEVIVPECGNKPWEMLAALRRGMYFESVAVTTEDRARYEDYKQNLNRRQFEERADLKNMSMEDFLQSLDMTAECGHIDEKTLARVTQLINKTNQFNLTTRRYLEEQVKKMYESPDVYWTRWYRLKDRFGDQGIIGVIIANKKEEAWHVDTWLMSCRVLGRQMEKFMFADLAASAKADGALFISAEYIPTPKNVIVKDLYPKLGFTYNENNGYYIFDMVSAAEPECNFIRKL